MTSFLPIHLIKSVWVWLIRDYMFCIAGWSYIFISHSPLIISQEIFSPYTLWFYLLKKRTRSFFSQPSWFARKRNLFVMEKKTAAAIWYISAGTKPHLSCLAKGNHLYITFVCCAMRRADEAVSLCGWRRIYTISHVWTHVSLTMLNCGSTDWSLMCPQCVLVTFTHI